MAAGETREYWELKDSDYARIRSHDVLKVAVAVPGLLETSQMRLRLRPLMYQSQFHLAIQQNQFQRQRGHEQRPYLVVNS